ncbi:putative disease resistance protein RGA1 isoform X2 [Triticum aestivum]|uniref:putative disease resistance protein RGA1 isoform X2 n=1 Tax=Triticum aestivum TaxID=4565 RepID=UPI001D026972|nr:putative disease resistance protein RGA1 isoform X2 [Triticum aestivum]
MSGFGEIIASAVGKQIASKLGELVTEEATLQWRFREDVDVMVDKMQDLEAVWRDADDKLRRRGGDGEAVRRWLTKFKSVAYDVEDVLDDLEATELLKKSQPKLKLFFSWNNQILQRVTMPHKLKNLRGEIEKIGKEGHDLNLVRNQERAEGSRNNETFVGSSDEGLKSGVVGRDMEKDKIIRLLLNYDANAREDISIVPIVGLGGLGKSTLAESVFVLDKMANNFEVRAWVHVSKEFDLGKIGRAILKSINSSINLDNCSLQVLQENLKKELAGRRYLIVLDDLWEEDGDKLERLKQMLQHGCKGSRVIVTTRNQSVVNKMNTGVLANQRKICPVPNSDQINLCVLSTDDCWEVMKQTTFGPDDDKSNLEEIGRKIAEKCGGVPLVAIALGQVMSEVRTVEAWQKIRDTNIDLGHRDHKDTLERLMLSYYYMKLEFKMCFAYLAAFPKGFVIGSDRLIQQWKALGYIHGGDEGKRCINYLMGMSFLQISKSSAIRSSPVHANAPRELTMHDLVHDLATIILGHECLVLNATEPRSRKKAKRRYCRHAQLINYQNQYKVFNDLPGNIRSLHVRHSEKQLLPQKAFSRTKYIRVLDLSGSLVVGQSTPRKKLLPSSTIQLKLLRYLDASTLPITSLPKSFHTLQNMETLILSNCSLATLSNSICSLSKLSYLDLAGNARLSKLPDKFNLLRKLIFLNMSSCSKLTKLPDKFSLECLEHLSLSGCHELKNLPQDFGNLQNLRFLNLSDCYKISVLPESFCLLNHLKDLNLSDCRALILLPECFGDLSELESLNLTSCPRLARLPESVCKMTNLKCLNLSYCLGILELPSSVGDLNLQILDISAGALRHLPDSISEMASLTQFVVTSGHPRVFGEAQEIKKRLKLPGRTVHRVCQRPSGSNSIVELAHVNCRELLIGSLQCVEKLKDAETVKLRHKSCVRQLALHWNKRYMNASLKRKMIANECSAESILERLIPARNLEQFMIQGYTSKGFPNWMSHISSHLPSVTYLSLFDLGACDNLPPFGQLPNLRSLYLQKIPNVTKIGKEFYGEGGTCTKLRLLQLKSMDNLVEWWTTLSGKEDGEFLIPNLHNLELKDCPKLKFLPYPPRSMFWFLDNSNEALVGPRLGFWELSSSSLPCRMGIKNCLFQPGKWRRLEQFPTLEEFSLTSCLGLRALRDVIRCFTSLKKLSLMSLEDLEILPDWLRHLTSLQVLVIKDCRNLRILPASMGNLTALRVLMLLECKGLDTLPQWLGQLSSLRELHIRDCPNITCFPDSIQNLTALEELYLSGSSLLVRRSRRENAYKVSHIRKVIFEPEEEPNEEQGQEESQEAWMDRLLKIDGENPWRRREEREELEEASMDRLSKKYGEGPSRHREERQELKESWMDRLWKKYGEGLLRHREEREELEEASMDRLSKRYQKGPSRHREEREELEEASMGRLSKRYQKGPSRHREEREELEEASMDRVSKRYQKGRSRHKEEREELESQMSNSDSEHLSHYGQEDSENEDDEQEDW